ncbi:MAG TPA: ATPase domain-containing protein [Thermoplasmata archaeon]|nr:ATPase domain-containing protein [Thermoplasmata archaeon]
MVAEARVSTGVPGLDRMLGGGLIPHRPYLVTGETGSGKTLLGLRFLVEGLRNGEDVLMVAVDEPPTEIMENVRSFGWDLSQIRTLDANPGTHGLRRLADVQEIRSLGNLKSMGTLGAEGRRAPDAGDEISIQSVYLKLRQQMAGTQYSRLVVDSLTSLRKFALKASSDPHAERTEIQSLFRFLSEKGVTALLTSAPPNPRIMTPEVMLSRGEILLTRKWIGDKSVRQIKVVRFRGSAHDLERRPFTITLAGIQVG